MFLGYCHPCPMKSIFLSACATPWSSGQSHVKLSLLVHLKLYILISLNYYYSIIKHLYHVRLEKKHQCDMNSQVQHIKWSWRKKNSHLFIIKMTFLISKYIYRKQARNNRTDFTRNSPNYEVRVTRSSVVRHLTLNSVLMANIIFKMMQ